jgi:hypothetical protein
VYARFLWEQKQKILYGSVATWAEMSSSTAQRSMSIGIFHPRFRSRGIGAVSARGPHALLPSSSYSPFYTRALTPGDSIPHRTKHRTGDRSAQTKLSSPAMEKPPVPLIISTVTYWCVRLSHLLLLRYMFPLIHAL